MATMQDIKFERLFFPKGEAGSNPCAVPIKTFIQSVRTEYTALTEGTATPTAALSAILSNRLRGSALEFWEEEAAMHPHYNSKGNPKTTLEGACFALTAKYDDGVVSDTDRGMIDLMAPPKMAKNESFFAFCDRSRVQLKKYIKLRTNKPATLTGSNLQPAVKTALTTICANSGVPTAAELALMSDAERLLWTNLADEIKEALHDSLPNLTPQVQAIILSPMLQAMTDAADKTANDKLAAGMDWAEWELYKNWITFGVPAGAYREKVHLLFTDDEDGKLDNQNSFFSKLWPKRTSIERDLLKTLKSGNGGVFEVADPPGVAATGPGTKVDDSDDEFDADIATMSSNWDPKKKEKFLARFDKSKKGASGRRLRGGNGGKKDSEKKDKEQTYCKFCQRKTYHTMENCIQMKQASDAAKAERNKKTKSKDSSGPEGGTKAPSSKNWN